METRTGQFSGGLRASAAYLPGLLLALGALAAEVSFTLVAVPLLPIFGPLRASAWVSACSVPVLFAGLVPFGAMGAELLLGAGTIRPADVAGAVLVAAGVAAGTGTRPTKQGKSREREKENTAAAPQLGRTRTGAPRA